MVGPLGDGRRTIDVRVRSQGETAGDDRPAPHRWSKPAQTGSVLERAAPVGPPLTAIRWGAVAVGAGLAAAGEGGWDVSSTVGLLVLIASAALRTWHPVGAGSAHRVLLVSGEVVLAVSVLLGTGFWQSPFVFSLIAAIGVAGFVEGFVFALRFAVVSSVALALLFLRLSAMDPGDILRLSAQWGVELVLVAVLAGYARRLSRDADVRHSITLDEVGRLTAANQLLSSLHEVAQDLPASLDLEQVLDSTVTRLRSLWDVSALAVLVPDETSDRWMVVRQEGTRLPRLSDLGALPRTLGQAAASRRGLTYARLGDGDSSPGLSPSAGSGLYAPLHARGELVGLIALEHGAKDRFGDADVELLHRFTATAALAIDNARWFARLRTVGADAERTRIARDLHDSVGQSLASIGFELDRLSLHSPDDELRPGMVRLRNDLRGAVREIRDTLYDLRTEVSEGGGMVDTLGVFLERVAGRSGVVTGLRAEKEECRLPLLQEREMWRVAQEAITNAERHGRPKEIDVWWHCDGHRAELEVVDDGCGFDPTRERPGGSYGMVGMRERAASIGAQLSIDSAPGRGTRVRCSLSPS